MRWFVRVLFISSVLVASGSAQPSFVNWENPHVSPMALTPDGVLLLAVNTPDGRLEVFDLTGPLPVVVGSVPVGVDPVSVCARSNSEAWVVNHISDSISVVDLTTMRVVETLATGDEPADVVFAGGPQRAFVTCSQANEVWVFDPGNLTAPPSVIAIDGEDPRALAVSADGSAVYTAVFESGNRSTVLGGGLMDPNILDFPPNVVTDPAGPYGGVNPPPNSGTSFDPPMGPFVPLPPRVSLIVKKDANGQWMDDNSGNWTDLVSGANAGSSGRPVGWDLVDHDVAIIDANQLTVTYATGLMNLCMALTVHPVSGEITLVGTDATNEVRFEPNLNGTFVRVEMARVSPNGATLATVDLNPHLDYSLSQVPQGERDKSIGDPRGVAWLADGSRGFVTGMGSNNVIVVDAAGARVGAPIEVGEGPTGVVVHPSNGRLYVLNKFAASVSVVDLNQLAQVAEVPLHDASPVAIKAGRRHLYDTHQTSGLGHASCASCHADARLDRLAWDLGDPSGSVKSVLGQNLGAGIPGLTFGFQSWHPMKGPMTTQTLQDIIGKEPHHWRGDRAGIEEFNPAFVGLLGDDQQLTSAEMQEFEDFLATIYYPPNPYRDFDNSLPSSLPLPGHFTTGDFGAAGQPLPNGDATRALIKYRPPNLLDAGNFACATCHTLPTGMGTTMRFQGGAFQPLPDGPNGEKHHALVSVDSASNRSMKVAQLRNLYEKVGMDFTQTSNRGGFGFLHDGSIDSLARFVGSPAFLMQNDQDVADMVAFMLAFSGSDLPLGSTTTVLEAPGTASQDTHAAVGTQTTVANGLNPPSTQSQLITDMLALADAGRVGVIVKGTVGGIARGYAYAGSGSFQSDRQSETISSAALLSSAGPGSELTYTVVPFGTEGRVGIDRDEDGFLDRDEIDQGSDPADPVNVPGCGAMVRYGAGCAGSGGLVPVLEARGCLKSLGNVEVRLQQGLGGSTALLLLGLTQASTPIGGGCQLLVAPLLPAITPLPLGGDKPGTGSVMFSVDLPAGLQPGLITMQAAVLDPGAPLSFTTSNGVAMTLP